MVPCYCYVLWQHGTQRFVFLFFYFFLFFHLIADRLVPCMEDDDHCHPEAYHDESHMHRVGYGMYQFLPFILC